jgi:hypothetical protein
MGAVRAHSRLALALGACLLAAIGAVAGFALGRGGETAAMPTTGQLAPITVSRQRVGSLGAGLPTDVDPSVQANLSTMLTRLPGRHHYGVTIANTSSIGLIDSLQWYPPTGVRIVKVTGSDVGHCELSGLSGFGGNQFKSVVLYPNILCNRVNLKPPSCTCLGDGGSVTVQFVADRDMGAAGVARMISARVVLRPIRSFLTTEATPQDLSTMKG